MSQPKYLGDGVYIQRTGGGMLAITTGRHLPTTENPGDPPDNVVFLENCVVERMLSWICENDAVMPNVFNEIAQKQLTEH